MTTSNVPAFWAGITGSAGQGSFTLGAGALAVGANRIKLQLRDVGDNLSEEVSFVVSLVPDSSGGSAPTLANLAPVDPVVRRPRAGSYGPNGTGLANRLTPRFTFDFADRDADVHLARLRVIRPGGEESASELSAASLGLVGASGSAESCLLTLGAADLLGDYTVELTLIDHSGHESALVLSVTSGSLPNQVLAEDRWNGLGGHARALRELGAQRLERFSPLQLRLMVALVSMGETAEKAAGDHLFLGEFINALRRRLGSRANAFTGVVGRLAVLRTAFDARLLDSMGAGDLDEQTRVILERALLFGDEDGLRLHESIARIATGEQWLGDDQKEQAHRKAAEYHLDQFQAATEEQRRADAVRHEMEAVHHYSEAVDLERVVNLPVYFVEQYDALGKALSLRRRCSDAVEAYRRALRYNSQDAYAHHYLAFNLDIDGRSAADVQSHYETALRLEPGRTWHHGRLICFLITRGRLNDALEQWRRALAELTPHGPSQDAWVYEQLHRFVARLLLHRSELGFAERVLRDVPAQHRRGWYKALRRLLDALREAEDNRLVFPPHIPVSERWNGPHLLPNPEADVDRWKPGRVHRHDGTWYHVRVATQNTTTGEINYGWLDLKRREFNSKAKCPEGVAPGTFVEVVSLTDGTERIYRHELRPLDEYQPDLPPVWPPANRYVRRGAPQP